MVLIFVLLGTVFAGVHLFATKVSLYWYYWWFDIMMHFWGGILIGLGVHSFCTFSRINLKPTLKLVLFTLLLITVTWEVFERLTGLFVTTNYLFDTAKDIVMGFSGGLLAHIILKKYTIG